MVSREHGSALLGRRSECEALSALVDDVRAGNSRALVLRGEAGVGKSALLDYVVAQASPCVVTRAVGVESEMELPYAALHQLCAPFLSRLAHLPEPQNLALSTAFGGRSGEPPDRFLVGLAVLSLLSEAAQEGALIFVIDDAQWLDLVSAQTLAFVARRLAAESVALILAIRDSEDIRPCVEALAGIPEIVVHGLADAEARALLDLAVQGPLDVRVRDRIVSETRGNPLALLELPRGMTPAELSFGFGPAGPEGLTGRIEQGFARRLDTLPAPTRLLLLVAAAEPVGDVTLLWRAASALGVAGTAAAPAEEAGLLELGAQVRFRHPLVRSAAYRSATADERRRVHRALADATESSDPDRRAWHIADATAGLDEDVAVLLETSADRAQARGGWAGAAAFLARAAELTPDPGRRAERALAAAQARLQAGAADGAHALLSIAEAGPLTELDAARAQLLGAQIEFAATRGRNAPAMLLAAAKRLEPLDATLAKETYLDAFSAALFAGRLATAGSIEEVARAVLAADWGTSGRSLPRACDLLLTGLAFLLTQGHVAGAPTLRRALEAFRDEPMSDPDSTRWLWLASRVARAVGDDAAWDELTERHVTLSRRTGALGVLPIALTERFSAELFAGRLTDALSLVTEADAVIEATGNDLSPHIHFLIAAWRGDEAEVQELIDASRRDVADRGEGLWLMGTEWTSAVFFNGLGRYDEALAAASRAAEHPHELGLSTWVYPELIEAAVRAGVPERADEALERLGEIARACGTDWALGIDARSRALLAPRESAEGLYREAIERLAHTCVNVTLARAHLLYGEWLRREGRRMDAREHLRPAHEFFLSAGMTNFAERTRRELTATGETVRARTVDTASDLTAQEALIARLAADGSTNPEIGAQLFISPRTVEWHLRKVFSKLGVTSRRGLRNALPQPSGVR